MPIGTQEFEYHLGGDFFVNMESLDIHGADLDVKLFVTHKSDVYDLEFDILIPEGKNGYFNILHDFNGGSSTWALESHLHMSSSSTSAPGQGAVVAGGLNETIVCVYNE